MHRKKMFLIRFSNRRLPCTRLFEYECCCMRIGQFVRAVRVCVCVGFLLKCVFHEEERKKKIYRIGCFRWSNSNGLWLINTTNRFVNHNTQTNKPENSLSLSIILSHTIEPLPFTFSTSHISGKESEPN